MQNRMLWNIFKWLHCTSSFWKQSRFSFDLHYKNLIGFMDVKLKTLGIQLRLDLVEFVTCRFSTLSFQQLIYRVFLSKYWFPLCFSALAIFDSLYLPISLWILWAAVYSVTEMRSEQNCWLCLFTFLLGRSDNFQAPYMLNWKWKVSYCFPFFFFSVLLFKHLYFM